MEWVAILGAVGGIIGSLYGAYKIGYTAGVKATMLEIAKNKADVIREQEAAAKALRQKIAALKSSLATTPPPATVENMDDILERNKK